MANNLPFLTWLTSGWGVQVFLQLFFITGLPRGIAVLCRKNWTPLVHNQREMGQLLQGPHLRSNRALVCLCFHLIHLTCLLSASQLPIDLSPDISLLHKWYICASLILWALLPLTSPILLLFYLLFSSMVIWISSFQFISSSSILPGLSHPYIRIWSLSHCLDFSPPYGYALFVK